MAHDAYSPPDPNFDTGGEGESGRVSLESMASTDQRLHQKYGIDVSSPTPLHPLVPEAIPIACMRATIELGLYRTGQREEGEIDDSRPGTLRRQHHSGRGRRIRGSHTGENGYRQSLPW